MKKLIFILMTIFTIFAITGCPNDDVEEGQFWAQNMITKQYYQVDAEKLAENIFCVVWAEKGSSVDAAVANNVATAYNIVYTRMMNTFGWTTYDEELGEVNTMQIAHWMATGTTTDAKLTILLLDIKDNYSAKNNSYVAGYFSPINLVNDPHSNKLDMIYLDTNPAVPGSSDSNGTLAHEMQHLMNFVTTVAVGREDLMDLWVDEGLSSAAERAYSGKHSMNRVSWFNNNGNGSSMKGKIDVGNNFFVWENRVTSSDSYPVLDDYATVYLFFQWLRIQSNNNPDIYRKIILSDFSDYKAVTDVAGTIIDSSYNTWSLLLRDWLAANYINAPATKYGYKGELTVKAPMFPNSASTVDLYPGEGVYSKINVSEIVPSSSGNIGYAGFASGGSLVASGGSANSARLTYNINTNKGGSIAVGNTTGVASSVDISAGGSSLQIASNEFSGPYKVDAGFYLRRNGNNGVYVGKSDKILKVDRSKIKKVSIDE